MTGVWLAFDLQRQRSLLRAISALLMLWLTPYQPNAVRRVLQHVLGSVVQADLASTPQAIGQAQDNERTAMHIALVHKALTQ